MRRLLVIIFTFSFELTYSQLSLSGELKQSEQWASKLYILRVNSVESHSIDIVDTISIDKNGRFQYYFKNPNPQDLFYKILLPRKVGNPWDAIGTNEKNFFFILPQENETIQITTNADSVFFSTKIAGGKSNQLIQWYRDIQKPFFNLGKVLSDSLDKNPGKVVEIKQKYIPIWMNLIDDLKSQVNIALDTAQNEAMILMGLYSLFEANLGKLDSATIHNYLLRVKNDDYVLVRNLKKLANDKKSNRLGIVIPNTSFFSTDGQEKKLYDVKSEFTVIDFWASWCSPCRYANRNELPKLFSRYGNYISLLGISIDSEPEKWKKAVKTDNTAWPQYIDSSYSLKKLLGVDAVPLYLVLDKNYSVLFESISVHHLDQFLNERLNK